MKVSMRKPRNGPPLRSTLESQSSILTLRVTPRASRNEVTGWRGDTLRIRLTAPPVEGEANAACQEFLAELLDLRRADVQLIQGEKSREKRFQVTGLTFGEIQEKIRERFPETATDG